VTSKTPPRAGLYSDLGLIGRKALCVSQSAISNSRFNLSMMTDRAELHGSRSDLPNLTPLTTQFASSAELGATRSTKIPTKRSQLGLDFLTAAVIAASKAARLIASRVTGSGELDTLLNARANIVPPQLNPLLGHYLRKDII
jgi:hypothetical protein